MTDKLTTSNARYLKNPIRILYEDQEVAVFEKPSGLLVIPTNKNEQNTLVNIVNYQYARDQQFKFHPCHRLDKETSGAIIFAKGKKAQQVMMTLFKERAIQKKYVAIIHGHLKEKSGEIKKAVGHGSHSGYRKPVSTKPALTRFKVLKTMKSCSVVLVEPVTGRTNQIRIHFSQKGHPLVGDRKYSIAKNYDLKFRRTALHAHQLRWTSPFHHKQINVQSDLPKDMEVFLASH